MHVLYFHQHFSTPRGSTGTRSYEMARALLEAGHSVTMVCGSYSSSSTGINTEFVNGVREGIVEGIRVVEIELPYSNYDGLLRRSYIFCRFAVSSVLLAARTPYDVLFATSTPLTAGIPGVVMAPFSRKPFVFEVRDLWPELPRAMGMKNPVVLGAMAALERLCYSAADACIALSPGIAEGIRAKKKRGSLSMIPNGCDTQFFSPVKRQQSTLIKAVFTGAHGQANGLHAVLDAAAELKHRGDTSVELHFIGDGKEKPGLLERAEREQLTNCYFHAPLPKQQLKEKMAEFDVGLMVLSNLPAFYYGTSPNKFFDYIACGMPVLNNYPGWLAGLITDNRCGLAVSPDDPVAFADALQVLAADPQQRLTMGKAARSLAERDFTRQELSLQFVAVLEKSAGIARECAEGVRQP